MITEELVVARRTFPEPDKTLAALGEEVGELCAAMVEHHRGGGKPAVEVLREAVQVATMAIRVATEGDLDFRYKFPGT